MDAARAQQEEGGGVRKSPRRAGEGLRVDTSPTAAGAVAREVLQDAEVAAGDDEKAPDPAAVLSAPARGGWREGGRGGGGPGALGSSTPGPRHSVPRRPSSRAALRRAGADPHSPSPSAVSRQSSASAAYMGKKSQRELEALKDALQREVREKDEEIAALREVTQTGALQKKQHQLLLENREMRLELEEYRAREEEERAREERGEGSADRVAALEDEIFQLRAEHDDQLNELHRQLAAAARQADEAEAEARAQDEAARARAAEIQELRAEAARREEAASGLEAALARLRDGSRAEELEERVAQLTRVVEEREEDGEALAEQLDRAAAEIERLRGEAPEESRRLGEAGAAAEADAAAARRRAADSGRAASELEGELRAERARAAKMEQELAESERRGMEMRDHVAEMERGLGIEDAMRKVRNLKARFRQQEKENVDLKNRLNTREKHVHRLAAENRALRGMAGVADDWGMDEEALELAHRLDMRTAEAENLRLGKVVEHLEAERGKLLGELRDGAIRRSEAGFEFYGLEPAQTELLAQYAERLRGGDESLPLDDRSAALAKELDAARQRALRLEARCDALEEQIERAGAASDRSTDRVDPQAYRQIMRSLSDLQQQVGGGGKGKDKPDSPAASLSAAARDVLARVESLPGGDRRALMATAARLHPDEAAAGKGGGGGGRRRFKRSGASGDPFASFDEEFPPGSPFRGRHRDGLEAGDGERAALYEDVLSAVRGGGGGGGGDDDDGRARLVECVRDLFRAEGALRTSNDALEEYRQRYDELLAAQQVVGARYRSEREKWKRDLAAARSAAEDAAAAEADAAARAKMHGSIAELVAALEALAADERGRELARQLARAGEDAQLAQVGERVAVRRQKAAEAEAEALLQRRDELEARTGDAERALRTRVADLTKARDAAQARAQSLSELVQTWVPREEVVRLARDHDLVCYKYAQLLRESAEGAVKAAELGELRRENEELKDRLARGGADDKTAAAGEDDDRDKGGAAADEPVDATRHRNALRRAERLADRLDSANRSVASLEADVTQLTARLADALRNEQVHREAAARALNKFEGCLPFQQVEELRAELARLREEADALRAEVERRRAEARLASRQAVQIREAADLRVEEVSHLRDAVRDMQEKSDDALIVGKLQHSLVQARLAATEAGREAARERSRAEALEAGVARHERKAEERNADLFRAERTYRQRLASRDRSIAELRHRISAAAMSMREAEVLHRTNASLMAKLDAERQAGRAHLAEAQRVRLALAEAETRAAAQDEMLSAFSLLEDEDRRAARGDAAGAADAREEQRRQLFEWGRQVRELRLSEMRLKHHAKVLESTVQFLRGVNAEHDGTIARLQQSVSEKEQLVQERELEWKQREAELNARAAAQEIKERIRRKAKEVAAIAAAEEADAADAAAGGGGTTTTAAAAAAGVAAWRDMVEELKSRLASADSVMRTQDTELRELRERMRLTVEARDDERARRDAAGQLREAEKQRILSTAQETIESLHKLLAQKNDAIGRYQDMLEKAVAKHKARHELDEQEIARLQREVMDGGERAVSQMHRALSTLDELPGMPEGAVTREEHERVSNRAAALHAEVETLQTRLEAARRQLAAREEELRMRAAAAAERERELGGAGAVRPSSAASSDAGSARGTGAQQPGSRLVRQLKRRVADRDAKIRALEGAVQTLKRDFLAHASDAGTRAALRRPATPDGRSRAVQEQEEVAKARKRIALLQSQVRQQRRELEEARKAVQDAEAEAGRVRVELDTERRRAARDGAGAGEAPAAQPAAQAEPPEGGAADERVLAALAEVPTLQERIARLQAQLADERRRSELLEQSVAELAIELERSRREAEGGPDGRRLLTRRDLARLEEARRGVLEVRDENQRLRAQLEVEAQSKIMALQRRVDELEAASAGGGQAGGGREGDGDAQDRLLAAETTCLELRFRVEQASVVEARLRERLAEAEAAFDTAVAVGPESPHAPAEKAAPPPAPEPAPLPARAPAPAARAPADVERLAREVSRLEAENARLAKQAKENKRLRAELKTAASALASAAAPAAAGTEAAAAKELRETRLEVGRLVELNRQTRRELKREQDQHERARARVLEKAREAEAARAELDAAREEMAGAQRAGSVDLYRASKVMEDTVAALERRNDELAAELRRKTAAAGRSKKASESLRARVVELEEAVAVLERKYRQALKRRGVAAPHAVAEGGAPAAAAATAAASEAQLRARCAALAEENAALKEELGAFDLSFFEEIEDLKFRYSESLALLKRYEEAYGPVHQHQQQQQPP